jgi:L-fuculose-phosphate aldolase
VLSNEDAARDGIVRYCRRLWKRRLVTGTSGNVSVKLSDGTMLVTPSQRSLGSLRAVDIVHVGADGRALDPAQRPSSEFPLHLAAYRARHDANCVIHTHPTFCVVWSAMGEVFPQETVGSRETLGPVGWCAYFPAGSQELADACGERFAGGVDTVLMERHGLTTIGPALEDAFVLADLAEEAARVAYFVTAGRKQADKESGGPS